MITHSVKTVEQKNDSFATETSGKLKRSQPAFQIADNRSETVMQRKLKEIVNAGGQVSQLMAFNNFVKGKVKTDSGLDTVQRKKKLNSKPELPPQPNWKNADWAQYDEEVPDQEEVNEPEQASNNSPVHKGPKQKGFVPDAIPGKQMGTMGTLFMVGCNIAYHHISIECSALGNGRVEISGGHLTDERIPEGEPGRRVNDLTEAELAPYRRQAEEKQIHIDKKEAEQRELQRKQAKAAELADAKSKKVEAFRAIVNSKIKIKKEREVLTDFVLNSAVDNGWTKELFESAVDKEKDVVQLAQIR